MTIWKDFYLGTDQWTTWDHAIQQTTQLLVQGAIPCKILIRNITGQPVGDTENLINISMFDSDSTSTSPRKRIWTSGDLIDNYPNPDSVKVFVDGAELHRTYSTKTIMGNSEFYIEVQDGLVGYVDNVSIYLNRGFNPSGHTIGYTYTTRAKSILASNLQPIPDANSYRSPYGFIQYLDSKFTFRELPYPNCVLISFPPPIWDTRFQALGSSEQWQGRVWTTGTPVLHEFDVLYRINDQKYFEIRDWQPNPIFYQNNWVMLTQSFQVTEISPTDVIRQFPLI